MKTGFAKTKEMNGRRVSTVAPVQNPEEGGNGNLGERVSHQLYEKMNITNPGRVAAALFTLRWIMPAFFVTFAVIYFIIGLSI